MHSPNVYGQITVTLQSTQSDNHQSRMLIHTLQLSDRHYKKVGIDVMRSLLWFIVNVRCIQCVICASIIRSVHCKICLSLWQTLFCLSSMLKELRLLNTRSTSISIV
jgi:hypothetical protein